MQVQFPAGGFDFVKECKLTVPAWVGDVEVIIRQKAVNERKVKKEGPARE